MLTQPKKDFSYDTRDESNLRLTFWLPFDTQYFTKEIKNTRLNHVMFFAFAERLF